MQINTNHTILDAIEQIGYRMQSLDENDKGFASKLVAFKNDILPVMDYLDCNESQAMLFSVVFFLSITDGPSSVNEIAGLLKCSPFEMIRLEPEMQELMKRKNIIKSDSNNRRKREIHYVVTQDLIDLISKGKKKEPIKEDIDLFALADLTFKNLEEYRECDITWDQLVDEINFYQERFPDLGILRLMNKFNFSNNEKVILMYVFTETCRGEDSIDFQWGLNKYIDKTLNRLEMRRLFSSRKANLVVSEILEFKDDSYRADRYIKFTHKATELIFGEESLMFDKKTFNPGSCILIEHTAISEKELYYNEQEQKELSMLEEIIQPEKYKIMVERLAAKKLPTGICTILHGYPGTGKTESVYQLARKSQRNILLVDISQIRDKYVGESEKQLKEVFNVYRRALTFFSDAPILLFNESDALIAKRTNVSNSVDQMNNTMQNVLLQEMENFSGVLMATTNLVQNLDSAFERRFLFKVKFSKPTILSRTMIWKSKIETLTDEDATLLAERFEF